VAIGWDVFCWIGHRRCLTGGSSLTCRKALDGLPVERQMLGKVRTGDEGNVAIVRRIAVWR
jgi:hypothetical protein